jgi:hypothetical protein
VTKPLLSLLILACAALAAFSNVEASTLYLAANLSNTSLYTVDPSTAATTLIGSESYNVDDLASDWRPSSFRLWGVEETDDRLYQINPVTGLGTAMGTFGTHINSIAFDVTSGQLYGADGVGLYRINPATAAITFVGLTARSDVRSIGFDLSGNLYGAGGSSLVKIDTSTGAAATVGSFGGPATMYDLAVRPEDGTMFAVGDPFSSSLYQVNTATGQATLIAGISGITFNNFAHGLAFSPAVPEPSALVLLLIAAAHGVRWRLQRVGGALSD